jgi:hypothetical protein
VSKPKYSIEQNAQARFIVERLRKAMPVLSAGVGQHVRARESLAGLERALAAYDAFTKEHADAPDA